MIILSRFGIHLYFCLDWKSYLLNNKQIKELIVIPVLIR